ncbi:MAG: hypothetical protein EOP40_12045 [Rubrivivax sp.]|nr:MAG: hypothetical protein EOP40_12045 [Rubrivivax sp.]
MEESVLVACRAFRVALRSMALGVAASLFTALVLPSLARSAPDDATRAIAVIYPDIGEPYRTVFSTILQGIEERARARVPSYAVGAASSTPELAAELRRRDIKALVALGRNGMKLASGLDRQLDVVAGGVLSVPESEAQGMSVHTLAPDPALLFSRLKTLVPTARRVIVVYDPRQNAWLIKLAQEAARTLGLELTALEASDLKTAIRLYQDTLSAADPRRDVLWLPQDSTTVEESAVLPLVLKEAWDQNLVLFSSSVAHVKRGALFSLYPDNFELGRTLASWALSPPAGGGPAKGVQPLKDVLMAVNTRTANHLGINLRASSLRFNLVFPEP